MAGIVSDLDHVGLVARNLDSVAQRYEQLGFQLTARSQHAAPHVPGGPPLPIGSANRCAMLRQGYIELLAIVDPSLPDNQLGAFLRRYEGLHIIAFAVDDAGANVARLRAAGMSQAAISPLQRMAATPQGERLAAFARIPLPADAAPEGRIQLIQHLTPDVLWQKQLLVHPNHAEALTDTVVCVADPEESVRRFARLTGATPMQRDKSWTLSFSQSAITFVTPVHLPDILPPAEAPIVPFIAGFVVRTDDGNAAAAAVLSRNSVAFARRGSDLIVPPQFAGGATLVFSAGRTSSS